MSAALRSLIHSGTKLWLDSIDPDLVVENFRLGATGATSNPIIVADLLKSGRFDDRLRELSSTGRSDSEVAWQMTAELVGAAEQVFLPVWQQTDGNDGYVSFELDPLLEDPELDLPHAERVAEYIASGKRWSAGHPNRMI
ncbi:MAG: transaldolase family protein [Planctomycetota bacterium]